MPSHRYWRFTNFSIDSGSFVEIAETYLRLTSGGANYAVSTAYSSSQTSGATGPTFAVDGLASTEWKSGFGESNPPASCWITLDHGAAVTNPLYVFLQASPSTPTSSPNYMDIYYSDDNVNFTLYGNATFTHPWTAGQTQVVAINVAPAIAVNIKATVGKVLTVRGSVPAGTVNTTMARILAPLSLSGTVKVTEGKILTVCSGRVGQPNLVAWTFTLDSHDFYALRLGDNMTLIYDQKTQQWAEWGEDIQLGMGNIDTLGRWQISTGINWPGITPLSNTLGSNVVAGDDSFGAIYVFDPGFDEDYKPSTGGTSSYHRFAQGQIIVKGRDAAPLWGVRLSGSVGEQWTGALVNVELQSSDDMGNSYYTHGVITVPQNSLAFRLDWNSLGSMNTPGRLLKVIDDGAIVRLDALDSYERDPA